MKKFAVMDIGSNTVRLVIYETHDYVYFKQIETFRHRLRLRSYVKDEMISEEGIEKLEEVLKYFKASVSLMEVEEVFAFATATLRDAKNGAEILEKLNKKTDFLIKIISAKKEAYYGYLSVINSTFVEEGLTVDMGGGSTEVVLFHNRTFQEYVSLPFGSLSLSIDFAANDESVFKISKEMEDYVINQFIKKEEWLHDVKLPIVAMGGSARTLAKIHMSLKEYPMTFSHQYIISREEINELYEMISQIPLKELVKLPGVTEERLDTIIPSIGFFKLFMEYSNSPSLVVSTAGIREGFCYSLMEERYRRHIPNLKKHAIDQLTYEFRLKIEENQREVEIYKMVCDQVEKYLDEKILKEIKVIGEHALKLYNLGAYVSDENSLKHTFYILTNRPLDGYSHKQQVVLALLASYKSKQRMLHYVPQFSQFFSKKEWTVLCLVGSIVRTIKELLSKYPKQIESMSIDKKHGEFRLKCTTVTPILYTESEIQKIVKSLEKVLKSKVSLYFTYN